MKTKRHYAGTFAVVLVVYAIVSWTIIPLNPFMAIAASAFFTWLFPYTTIEKDNDNG